MFRDSHNLISVRALLAGHALDLAAIRLRLLLRKTGFNPDQPRLPAGQPGGGRWTDGGGDGPAPSADALPPQVVHDTSGQELWDHFVNVYALDGALAAQTVFNRDGSTIESLFNIDGAPVAWDERHTIVTTDGDRITFENAGPVQSIFTGDGSDGAGHLVGTAVWTDDGPQPLLHPAYVGPTAPIVEAALALFTFMSSQNDSTGAAVFAFRANEFRPDDVDTFSAVWVGRLTRDEVNNACPRHEEVQGLTNEAADTARRERNYWTASGFGTAVHRYIEQRIRALLDPNFRSEISLIKIEEETGVALPTREGRYGEKDTIRIDVLENPGSGTVCVYDIKTGRRGLGLARSAEIAGTVYTRYPTTQRIIVIETRPR